MIIKRLVLTCYLLAISSFIYAQESSWDVYDMSIYNLTHTHDNNQVIISFDISFSDNLIGKDVMLGVEAYLNPDKLLDYYEIITSSSAKRIHNPEINREDYGLGWISLFSGKKIRVTSNSYQNIIICISRSTVQKAIGNYGKYVVSFVPMVYYETEPPMCDGLIRSHPAITYTYTFNPPSNNGNNGYRLSTEQEKKPLPNINATFYNPENYCEFRRDGSIILRARNSEKVTYGTYKLYYYLDNHSNVEVRWENGAIHHGYIHYNSDGSAKLGLNGYWYVTE